MVTPRTTSARPAVALPRPRGTDLRRAGLGLIVAALTTVVAGCSLVDDFTGGASTPAARPTTTKVASPTPQGSPGPVQALFADPSSAASQALQRATAQADADTARLAGAAGAGLSASQRILECPEGDAPDWHLCVVWAFHYLTWDGDFGSGHDGVIEQLAKTCSFEGTAMIDWTPPPGTARQQQGLCPDRPNAWVHWATNSWDRGIESCGRDWYNDCGLPTADIMDAIARHDWLGRVRLGYPLDAKIYVEPEPTGQATEDADGRPTEYAVLFGTETATAREKAGARAEAAPAALDRRPGVTLAGTQRRLDCVQGRDNEGRADSGLRLVCHVQVTQYLTWSGDFARGRRAILAASARVCAWSKESSTFDWRPTNQTSTQQQPNCAETPSMYLDWMKPHAKDLVYPCRRDARTSCTPKDEG